MTIPATDGRRSRRRWVAAAAAFAFGPAGCTVPLSVVKETSWAPEQQHVAVRDPAQLPPAPIPEVPRPPTVADEKPVKDDRPLTLNEAVRITLENAKAVRVFTGLGATNSGRTIYDAAIAVPAIDQAQARFDPNLNAGLTQSRTSEPSTAGVFASQFGIGALVSRSDDTHAALGVSKVNTLGGTLSVNALNDRTSTVPWLGGLNPADTRSVELNYTQPLLKGGGFLVNTAPIVLARNNVEQSFFQFKDATQELVRGTIEAYWNLVFSRLSLWAAQIQVEQSQEAYNREQGRRVAGINDARNVAQADVTLNQFKARLVAAKADVLDREAALRNVLGLPPADGKTLVPVSAPAADHFRPEWDKLLKFAEQRRPDLIELKLILEADATRRIQAENNALPQLDATALYRINGLSGHLPPSGERFTTEPGQFGDWSVGITFSVPLGLRDGRAQIRQQDLTILRDKANLEQGLHSAAQDLATTVRGLESAYEQYLAYRATRTSALENLRVQIAERQAGRGIYLDVLQALNDWGSAVASEAQALTNYNVLLATLERQTGTILETHGLVFIEERFQAAGPMILHEDVRDYPRDLKPKGEPTQYPSSGQPGENAFDLKRPDVKVPEPKAPPVLPGPKFAEGQ
jgi:outer membrane protein TolC